MDLPLQLQELLPSGYSYKIKNWTTFEKEPTHFETVILTNIYTEEEAQEWWHEFNVKSNTTMRVRATCPKTGRVNTFKIYLRCLHQGRAEKTEKQETIQKPRSHGPLKRNTNCPAGMVVAVRRVVRYSRSKKRDPVDAVHPCEIQIRFIHNHPIKTTDSLRFRPVSKEAEDKILSLYQAGHSPTSALDALKIDLQIEHGSLYSEVVSDRYYCPDKPFCYRLYYKHFGKDYASSAKKDIRSSLSSKVSHYNSILGETCLTVGMSGAEYVVAACTPLMKRSHSLMQSGDIVYIESYECPANKDKFEHHVLLLNAHTSAGGIPLGAVLATSNSAAVLTSGFQLLKQLLPNDAFCGRGTSGPHAFLIEDSDNQKAAVNSVWPDSDVIICIFRILQSMWRWLWDDKHNVLKDHRLYLLYLLKTVLFASSDSELATKYQALCSDGVIVHYPVYLHLVESLWQRRHLWRICFYRVLPLQGASNYYEAAVRALKDKVFEQARTFNIIQLLNFLVTRLDFYYKTKFLNILQGKIKHIFLNYFPDRIPPHIVNNIKQIAGNYYVVPHENGGDKFHTIDAELNSCSCFNGLNGALCIHQYWVYLKVPSDMFKIDLSDVEFKQKLFTIASGASSDHYELALPSAHKDNLTGNCSEKVQNQLQISITESTGLSLSESPINFADMLTNSEASLSCTKSCSTESPNLSVNSVPQTFPVFVNTSQPVTPVPPDSVATIAVSCSNASSVSLSSSLRNEVAIKDIPENSKLDSRKTMALENFEKFCQKVKDGLKNQTEDFLPALEIMMKNIQRKGNTAEQIISGLNFFGIVSAPSLGTKTKKRPASVLPFEELIPKVHGRQMITYGKKKFTDTQKSSSPSQIHSTKVMNISVRTENSTGNNS